MDQTKLRDFMDEIHCTGTHCLTIK